MIQIFQIYQLLQGSGITGGAVPPDTHHQESVPIFFYILSCIFDFPAV